MWTYTEWCGARKTQTHSNPTHTPSLTLSLSLAHSHTHTHTLCRAFPNSQNPRELQAKHTIVPSRRLSVFRDMLPSLILRLLLLVPLCVCACPMAMWLTQQQLEWMGIWNRTLSLSAPPLSPLITKTQTAVDPTPYHQSQKVDEKKQQQLKQ